MDRAMPGKVQHPHARSVARSSALMAIAALLVTLVWGWVIDGDWASASQAVVDVNYGLAVLGAVTGIASFVSSLVARAKVLAATTFLLAVIAAALGFTAIVAIELSRTSWSF
jgi:hypothetical protein